MNIKSTNPIKLKKISKKILLSNAAGMIALLLFTHVIILYSEEKFEIPFIDRSNSGNVTIEYELGPREEAATEPEEVTEDITNIQEVINPAHLIEPEPDAKDEENPDNNQAAHAGQAGETDEAHAPFTSFEVYSDDVRKLGYTVSDGIYAVYDEEEINAEKNAYRTEINRMLSEGGDSQYMPPEPELYEYKFVQIEPEHEMQKARTVSVVYTSKPSVETLMDYIIIRNENLDEILCDSSGKIITRDFVSAGYEILKMRTPEDNRTVFKKDGLYYIYDPHETENGSGGFVNIKFDERYGDRGVPFMYPSYYGAYGANGLSREYNGRNFKWGYRIDGTATYRISMIYGNTFNFTEEIGIAYQDSPGRGNKLFFFNERGQNLLTGADEYFAPFEVTAAHLGYFYFDHGLTRAYSRVFDRDIMATIEREIMLEFKTDANGNAYFKEFYLPEDYNVKAYSNGMILLEKDGFYGFMNHLGEWVAQPIYKYAQPFYEGVAVIGLENGKRAIIDTKGNLLIRFKYDSITNCTGGIIALYEKNEGWTILNKVRRKIDMD